MSLQPYELDIIKQQLGVTLTRVGAEPYIQYVALFDNVIQPFLYDNSTTSSTSVAAGAGNTAVTVASNPAAPNNVTQSVFAVGSSVVVDVGPAQEVSTIIAIASLSFTIYFQNAHMAPWPLYINGAEFAVRNILARIALIEQKLGTRAVQTAGIQKADEVSFYASSVGMQRGATKDTHKSLIEQRMQARDDLSGAIGFPNLWRDKPGNSAPGRIELY